jgi:glucose-6-phosphate-specific signal transduction histidine kinase
MAEQREQEKVPTTTAWLKWLLLWLPTMIVATWARPIIGLPMVMAALLVLLAATLLYQRYVNRRSWKSILWGVHVSDA